jgi:glutamate transport system substrate-binding protein
MPASSSASPAGPRPSLRPVPTLPASGTPRARRLRALNASALVLTMAAVSACSSFGGDKKDAAAGAEPGVATNAYFPPGTTMSKIQETGTVRIGITFDTPLFAMGNPKKGHPKGFDVEIGKIIAGALGIAPDKIDWVKTATPNRERYLVQDKVDMVLATYTINEERKKTIGFGGPYLVAGQALMIAADNPKHIESLDDLPGKKVCTAKGSTSAENIKDFAPEATLVLYDSDARCAAALKTGKVDATTTDNTALAGLKSEDPDAYEILDQTFSQEPYGIGVQKDADDLKSFIDDTLKESYDNGTWEAAWDRTVGKILGDAPPAPDPDDL